MSIVASSLSRWITLPIATLGSMLIAGTVGGLVGLYLNHWDEPFAGFATAFTAVGIAYVCAPAHRLRVAAVVCIAMSIYAFVVLHDATYPVYHAHAHEHTYWPLAATLGGGAMCFAITWVHHACTRPAVRHQVETNRDRQRGS